MDLVLQHPLHLCPTDTGTRRRRKEKGHRFFLPLSGAAEAINQIGFLPHFNRPCVMFTQNQQHADETVQDNAESICKPHGPPFRETSCGMLLLSIVKNHSLRLCCTPGEEDWFAFFTAQVRLEGSPISAPA